MAFTTLKHKITHANQNKDTYGRKKKKGTGKNDLCVL